MSIDTPPPIGTTYHREFRDLDPRRLPSAPPRIGQPRPESTQEKPMSKTQAIINYLKAHATDRVSAMKPAEISNALGGESGGSDASTIAALLRCAYTGKSAPNLRREQRGLAYYWYWGAPRLAAATPAQAAQAETPPADDEPDATDALLAAIDAIPAGATIPNAAIHAKRLRKMARLPWVIDEVSNWLYELADLVEGGAA